MSLTVGIVGAGLIGGKRAGALAPGDRVVAVYDASESRATRLADRVGAEPTKSLERLLDMRPDVVVVATTHDSLAGVSIQALTAEAHVLVEKPAGMSVKDIDAIEHAAKKAARLVKVGFNHRFHPGIRQAIADARSGDFGRIMFMRARYGHGGRLGYENEWRANPAVSGGGELIDQGMHLIDISHALLGPLPLHSALVHTDFWNMAVDDNAVVTLAGHGNSSPWSTFHVSCSEWKNLFDLEIYTECAKWHVSGLAGSYGPQLLRTFRMKPEMGPPDETTFGPFTEDLSWRDEWAHFRTAILEGWPITSIHGGLSDARYAHEIVADAYRDSGYSTGGTAHDKHGAG